jgi:hypothetical protein
MEMFHLMSLGIRTRNGIKKQLPVKSKFYCQNVIQVVKKLFNIDMQKVKYFWS